jgi:hypothetical protein
MRNVVRYVWSAINVEIKTFLLRFRNPHVIPKHSYQLIGAEDGINVVRDGRSVAMFYRIPVEGKAFSPGEDFHVKLEQHNEAESGGVANVPGPAQ